ncbi:hypothetical protein AAC387_Pa11g1994 [Persea americana]
MQEGLKMNGSCLQSCRSYRKPSWLDSTISDLEQQMQAIARTLPDEDESDSFAERAENYYRKRPQLLSLLQDLYNRYLTLADRYCQSLKHQPQIPAIHSDVDDDVNSTTDRPISITHSYPDSDNESSLSFQPAFLNHSSKTSSFTSTDETVVAELVSKAVENEILLHELEVTDRHKAESSRKMELQKSLLEVLESERMVLLSENARLAYKATAVAEENKGMSAEAAFMKKKATELARCVLKMREEHVVGRKMEELEVQIRGLEKRNREYYEELVKREEEKRVVVREVCIEVERLKRENARLKLEAARRAAKEVGDWWRVSRWLGRVKKFDLFPSCGGSYS